MATPSGLSFSEKKKIDLKKYKYAKKSRTTKEAESSQALKIVGTIYSDALKS